MKPYLLKKKEVLKELGVYADIGLADNQIADSVLKYGKNQIAPNKKISVFRRIWNAATDKMMIILIIAFFLALAVNIVHVIMGYGFDYAEVFGVLGAVVLCIAISVIMEGRSAKAFEALNNLIKMFW